MRTLEGKCCTTPLLLGIFLLRLLLADWRGGLASKKAPDIRRHDEVL